MKKLLCLLLAALLLCGCQPVQQNPTDNTTQPSAEATVPFTAPTETDPSESTDPSISMEQYQGTPEDYSAFVFQGYQPNQGFGPDIDLSGLTLGCLYVHDEAKDKVYPISHQPVAENKLFSVMTTTKDHLYFVLASDPTALIRTDYYGQDSVVAYRSNHGNISDISYYGVDPCGKLGIVENSDRFILYNIATTDTKVIMEQAFINDAYYSIERTRPYVLWHGTMEGDSKLSTYLYYPDTGDCVLREDL